MAFGLPTALVATTLTGLGAAPAQAATIDTLRAVYVSQTGGSEVSVINPETNAITATVTVGDEPRNLAVSNNRKWVYVPNRGDDTVSVIDTLTNTVIGAPIAVGDEPYAVAFNPDSTRAFVANKIDDTVSVINTATRTVVATFDNDCIDRPEGIAINPVTNRGYIVNRGVDPDVPGSVCVFNPTALTAITTIPVGIGPRYAVVTPDGKSVFVSNNGDPGTVSRINATTNTVTATIASTGNPRNMAINEAGNRVYVATNDSDQIEVINVANNAISSITLTGVTYSYGVALVSGLNYGFVTGQDSGDVVKFNMNTNTQITGAGLPITDGNFDDPRAIAAIGAPLEQTPANNCAKTTLKRVKAKGKTLLSTAGCETTFGNPIKTRATCKIVRGDVRGTCRVVRRSSGVWLVTTARSGTAVVRWTAPGGGNEPYRVVKRLKIA